MTDQDRILGMALELAMMKTQIIKEFYPKSSYAKVETTVTMITHNYATVISFNEDAAGTHEFKYDNEAEQYLLTKEV